MQKYDIVIMGGGPAGSTVGTLIRRYAPNLRILLLEKTRFPRHHIGESLLVGATPVLVEMGVYDKINRYGFIEKLGANYIWGKNRQPWGFTFDEITAKFAERGQTLPDIYTKTWQVRRAEYDTILLEHAAEMGVEVKQEARVKHVFWDGERAVGVEYQDEHGTHTVESSWLIDCTGQDALLSRELGLREYDERMNNYALFGYWKNARWKFEYLGDRNKTRIFIVTTPRGWLWYIPVSQELVSVGLVTHRQLLKQGAQSIEQIYLTEIAACDEVKDLLKDAQLTHICTEQKRDVQAIQDWSSSSRQMAGNGWAMVGDAAGFVDPILSSGVMLAQELGQKAAYTLNSVFKATNQEQIKAYWKFYNDTYHTYLRAYRDMASFWYSNNFSMESWWWQAKRTITQHGELINLTDRDAFNRVAFGYATRSESLSLFGSYPLHEACQLVNALFDVNENEPLVKANYIDRTLHLRSGTRITDGMYFYQGQIRTTRRIIGQDNRYIDLHPAEEILIKLFDGAHTQAELDATIKDIQALPTKMPIRNSIELMVQLDNIGVLA